MKIKYPKQAALLVKATRKDDSIKNIGLRYLEFIGSVTCKNNVALLDQVMNEIGGWPTVSKVGPVAAHAACLIVMFADHDVEWQRHQFNILSAFPKSEVDTVDVALIEDRICINRGIEQVYGTQFDRVGNSFVVKPIRNVATIDERRHRAGLDTLSSHIQRMNTGEKMKQKLGSKKKSSSHRPKSAEKSVIIKFG